MKKVMLVLFLSVSIFSSCGTQAKAILSNDLVMGAIKSALIKKDIAILKPFLSNDFSVGNLLGKAAIDKAGTLLKSGPSVTDVVLKGVTKNSDGAVLNTVMDIAGQSSQKSPVQLDKSGKISSIGFLTSLLGK